jgi:hypothetical protein
MPKSKKIFLFVAALFIATMIYITYDIFSRTTRPGAKKHLIESIKPAENPSPKDVADTKSIDSLSNQ